MKRFEAFCDVGGKLPRQIELPQAQIKSRQNEVLAGDGNEFSPRERRLTDYRAEECRVEGRFGKAGTNEICSRPGRRLVAVWGMLRIQLAARVFWGSRSTVRGAA